MPWYEMVDGTKKFLLPDAAQRQRNRIRRALPGTPAKSAPRVSRPERAVDLVAVAKKALEADTVVAMRAALARVPGANVRGTKEELIEKLSKFIANSEGE